MQKFTGSNPKARKLVMYCAGKENRKDGFQQDTDAI
jgi:hypothetical protein